MTKVLSQIINDAQSAFVEKRSMVENIHMAQELIGKYARKRVSPRCLIKVDIRNAYDSVSWSFLRITFQGLEFSPIFIQWVMECVQTASYSVRINGDIYDFFKCMKGLRQGDPISPYLYVACAEYFSRLLMRKTTGTEFNFHPGCEPLGITHLAYADDMMLFSRGDPPSVRILWDALSTFRDTSGLSVNPQKSSIFMAGVGDREKEEILTYTGIQVRELPLRYLGIPLLAGRLLVYHYRPLIDRITQQIGLWTAPSLFYAGRMQLITSMLQEIQCFWLSVLPVPGTVIDEVIGLCRSFL